VAVSDCCVRSPESTAAGDCQSDSQCQRQLIILGVDNAFLFAGPEQSIFFGDIPIQHEHTQSSICFCLLFDTYTWYTRYNPLILSKPCDGNPSSGPVAFFLSRSSMVRVLTSSMM